MKLGGLEVRNTKTLISPDTRICGLIYSPGKRGKTTLAASLADVTMKYRGKPTLFIACEVAEGGGTMSVAHRGLDYVQPSNYTEFNTLLTALETDETYGGVVLDNATDYVIRIVRPYALKFPSKERILGAREIGVPHRGDYQTMAESARQHLNKLVYMTNESTPERYRKDLIVTALEKEKTDDDGNLVSITPDFPGALANVATALFQSVVSIKIKNKVVPDPANPGKTKRVSARMLHVKAETDAFRVGDDRTSKDGKPGIFQHDFVLTDDDGKPLGLLPMYESWLQQFKVS